MNLLQLRLMDKPSLTPGRCVVCGAIGTTKHHVVPRSQGGTDGPVLELCGDGARGCHGKAEGRRLHFDWRDGWCYFEGAMRYMDALDSEGWRECR